MKLRSGNFVVNQVNFLRIKKYFVFIIILLASASLSYSMVSVSTENKEISFVQSEKKKVDSGDFERMNNVPIIMVHCDFGWKGICNGYYVSGVFKLNDPNIEHDPDCSYGGNTNYNNLLKIIMYDKP